MVIIFVLVNVYIIDFNIIVYCNNVFDFKFILGDELRIVLEINVSNILECDVIL